MHAKTGAELRQATEERDFLYEIVDFVAAEITVDQLLIKVADSLGNYFSATAVAAFMVQRLPHLNKANAVLARNFTRSDLEAMKDLFAQRWPASGAGDMEEGTQRQPPEAQKHFTTKISADKSSYVLPLFSHDLLQGILVLQWDYDRRSDFHSHMDDTLRVVAVQTALGIERQHLYSGVEKIGLTQANISRHLNILYRAGVVDRRREGSSVMYKVIDPNFVDICRTVSITVASRDLGDEMGVMKADSKR